MLEGVKNVVIARRPQADAAIPRKMLCHPEPKAKDLMRSFTSFRMTYLLLLLLIIPITTHAEEKTSQWWTTEVKGGFWMPTDSAMKTFFSPCCNLTAIVEQGFIYDSKYAAEIGVGYFNENGTAIGATSGASSQDRFNLFLLPMSTGFAFRADFKEDQIVVPYVKAGFDYVYFRQNLKGQTVNGLKTGLHVAGGVQFLLDMIDSGTKQTMENDFGINDLYFIAEARYSWINSFGGRGLDLSSLIFTGGLLFEY